MKNFRIKMQLLLGFGALILVMLFQSLLIINEMSKINDKSTEIAENWLPSVQIVSDLSKNFSDFRLQEMQHILSLTKEEMELYETRMEEFTKQIQNNMSVYEKLVSDEREIKLFGELRPKFTRYLEVNRDLISLSGQNRNEEAKTLLRGASFTLYTELNNDLAELVKINRAGGKRASDEGDVLYDVAKKTASGMLIGGILLSVIFMVFIIKNITGSLSALTGGINSAVNDVNNGNLSTRMTDDNIGIDFREIPGGINSIIDSIVRPIREASEVMSSMAGGNLQKFVRGNYKGDHAEIKKALNNTLNSFNEILGSLVVAVEEMQNGSAQISETSQSLSQGATEQAASVEEISAAVTELASQTKQSAQNARKANMLSGRSLDNSRKGSEMMGEMMHAMLEIKDGADNISKIIKAIDEIAFQTNLLSLNAAVEAARAGRHGKGFAVVAEEVKRLSDRSARAARETAEMIQESISRANNGSAIAEKTVASLAEISSGIEEVASLMNEVATASEEQSTGLLEIEKSIQQIEQVTQTNAANSEETAAASTELTSQAESIREMVSRFSIGEKYSETAV